MNDEANLISLGSRRGFLKKTILSAGVLVMSGDVVFGAVSPIQTLELVQKDLFPFADELKSNAYPYLSLILNHSRVSDSQKKFLRNGVQWLNESAVEKHNKIYGALSSKERQETLKRISTSPWGESWIETVLTYVMEAVLGDPIYAINKNEAGWEWLNHQPGLPRPTKALL